MKSVFRAKNVVFGLIAFMTACVLYHNERFLIKSSDPIWHHYQPSNGGCFLTDLRARAHYPSC